MHRFLFVVPPVAERARPAIVVGRELVARGHEVAWATHGDGLDRLAPPGASVFRGAATGAGDDTIAGCRVNGLRSPAGQHQLWDDHLLPLAREMVPIVHAAIEELRPDAIVADQHALAGAALAHARGLPWATGVPTSAGLIDPLWDLPAVRRRIRRRTRDFLRDVGLDELAAARLDPQASPHLVLAFTTPALAGPVDDAAGRRVFVGPCLGMPPRVRLGGDRTDRDRPLVVVSVAAPPSDRTDRLRRTAAEALSSLDVRAVLLGPARRPAALPDDVPDNVLVMPDGDLHTLVRRAAAVVCDGGHDVVCAALHNATPLVIAPMTGEQPTVAEQVVNAAAGVRLSDRHDPALLRRAVETVLTDTRIHHGARRIRDSFAAADATLAADHLELLLTAPPTRPAVRPAAVRPFGAGTPRRGRTATPARRAAATTSTALTPLAASRSGDGPVG